jgi:hypothetical protein
MQMQQTRSQPEPNRNRRLPMRPALTMRKARKTVCHHERRTLAKIQQVAQAGVVSNSTKLHTRFQIMGMGTGPVFLYFFVSSLGGPADEKQADDADL